MAAGGVLREKAWATELTDLVELFAWPKGAGLTCRRKRAHPGAQFKFTDLDGHRFTCF